MLGVRLDAETEEQLGAIARRTRRPKSEIARDAIRRYVRAHNDAYLAEARRLSKLAKETDPPEIADILDAALDETLDRFPE